MELNKQYDFPMTDAGAEECAAFLESLPAKYKIRDDRMAEIRLALKELAALLSSRYGGDKTFSLSTEDRHFKLNIYIKYKGEQFDPRSLPGSRNEYSAAAEKVINKYSVPAWVYSYAGGENIFRSTVVRNRRLDSFQGILIFVLLGILLGIAGNFMSSSTRASLINILGTIESSVLNLIIMSATLTVFTSVVNSISGFKSTDSVKETGLGVLKYHMVNYAIGLVFVFLFTFNRISFSGSGAQAGMLNSIEELSSLLSDMVPENYVSPLADCNFLHIIIIAFILGFAMLSVGEGAKPMREFFRSAEPVSGRIMDWFSGLMPLFLFAMIPQFIWSDNFSLVSDVVSYLVLILLSILLSAIAFLVYMCLKVKLPFIDSFKKILPAMLRGFLTDSSSLSIPEIQLSARRFGVKDGFNGYATAVGFIFSHVGIMIMELILVFGLLPVADTAITVPAVIRIIVSALLFSFADPPTGGTNMAIITIMFDMVGIGEGYLALVAPALIFADYVETAARCGEIVMGTVLAANEMGELE